MKEIHPFERDIKNRAKSQAQQAEKEYYEKISVLRSLFQEVPPISFIQQVFEGLEEDEIVVVAEEGFANGTKVWKTSREGLIDALPMLAERSDVYVCYASYYRGWYKEATLKEIHAFVVDVDLVPPAVLDEFLRIILPKMKVQPTFVYASGEGTQFIYKLTKPVPVLKRYRSALKELYRRLQLKFWPLAVIGQKQGAGTKVDVHGLTQAFRLPGTATKLGLQSRVFQSGEPVSIERLCAWLKVDLPSDVRPGTGGKKHTRRNKLYESGIDVVPRVFGGDAFYRYAYELAMEETQPGHRYLTLFALAVIAWKCQVPEEQLAEELETLVDLWKYRHTGVTPLKPSELRKALKGYNPKATLVSCRTLERWMGLKLRRDRMSKDEQVQKVLIPAGTRARQAKKLERMKAVVELRKQGLSWGEIARRLRISRSRACELYREAFTP